MGGMGDSDSSPTDALAEIVDDIHRHADDAEYIERVGVGPLESLFHQGYGEELWPEVERLARSDVLFRRALNQVWAYSSAEYARRQALLQEFADD
jgi:hypothetical protein